MSNNSLSGSIPTDIDFSNAVSFCDLSYNLLVRNAVTSS